MTNCIMPCKVAALRILVVSQIYTTIYWRTVQGFIGFKMTTIVCNIMFIILYVHANSGPHVLLKYQRHKRIK